jgi:molybdopterin-containing oxidoreductase family iron-sulfur binding subunit
MLIDTNKCADGCDACVDACNKENGLSEIHGPGTDAQWIRKVTIKNKATSKVTSLPLMCQHCENPPCVDVCPTGASFKREDGIVLVDKHICIGCRYCMMACPYKARSFIHEVITDQVPDVPRGKGTVESCTLCVHKVDRGDGTTACAEACAKDGHRAIIFGDLKDPGSAISKQLGQYQSTQLRPDLRLNTGVRYRGI